jgi:hypothetical protein
MKTLYLFVISACLTSCSFTVSSDGAKAFSVDGEQAAKAIKILTDK